MNTDGNHPNSKAQADRFMQRWDYTTGLRFPGEMAETIKEMAHENYRSFNQQVILMLAEYLKKPKTQMVLEELVRLLKERELKKELRKSERNQAGKESARESNSNGRI